MWRFFLICLVLSIFWGIMTHPVYALTCGDVCGGSYSTDCSGCIEAGAGSAACVKNVCTWSTGSTCTDWCNAGSCVAGPCSGGYCQDQVCCVGHPQELYRLYRVIPAEGVGVVHAHRRATTPVFPTAAIAHALTALVLPSLLKNPLNVQE